MSSCGCGRPLSEGAVREGYHSCPTCEAGLVSERRPSPFPNKCRCGHLQTEHKAGMAYGSGDHAGACVHPECACHRYVWAPQTPAQRQYFGPNAPMRGQALEKARAVKAARSSRNWNTFSTSARVPGPMWKTLIEIRDGEHEYTQWLYIMAGTVLEAEAKIDTYLSTFFEGGDELDTKIGKSHYEEKNGYRQVRARGVSPVHTLSDMHIDVIE